MHYRLALKVDIDTDRGTREGIPNLIADCSEFHAPACFLFALGPDNTGRALSRIFRPGFFKKVSRTNVVQMYGIRTLLNGTLFPAPHIARRNTLVIRSVRDAGFEVGIHCHDHYLWQDYLPRLDPEEIFSEFGKAQTEFRRIFGFDARCAGSAGWQSDARSRDVYERASLLYSSDTRGETPYFPRIEQRIYTTLEIPTTLPTLDELMGRPEYPDSALIDHYLSLLRSDRTNVMTIHAEIEGMGRRAFFRELLAAFQKRGVQFIRLDDFAREVLADRDQVKVHDQIMGEIDGRTGLVAKQRVRKPLPTYPQVFRRP